MFKLVVFCTLLAVVVAKPGYINAGEGFVGHGAVGAIGAGVVGHGVVPLPGAVSTISRTDVHGPEIAIPVHSVQPVVSHEHFAPALAPLVTAHAPALSISNGPIAHGPIALPSAVSHQSRYDVIHPGHQLVHSIQNVPVSIHVPTIHALPALHSVHGGFGGHY